MKKLLISALSIFSATFALQATSFTVSNNTALPGSPGQYTTIAAAITAASNGDTILVQPSPNAYASFTLNKGLTIIGSGYNPQTTNGLRSVVDGFIFSDGSSNSKLIGLYFTNSCGWNNNFAVSNFLISRCCFEDIFPGGVSPAINTMATVAPTGVTFQENIFLGFILRLNGTASTTVRNNIIAGPLDGDTQGTSHVIKNNLFLCTSNSIYSTNNSVIENNIFYGNFPSINCNNNTFNNNYVFGTSTLPFGTNIGSGNVTNTNTAYQVFVCGNAFSYSVDFRPVAGHVCVNGGTDGTDIGPTGGAFPIYIYPVPYPLTGEPKIPQVREITLPVSSVPAGGTLNINVKARKRD